MEVTSQMNLTIPSLKTPSGYSFQTNIDIAGNTADIIDETDISGYSLSMNIDAQSVVYEYDVITTNTGDDLITITSADSIVVNITLNGPSVGEQLSFSSFEGMVTPQDLGFDGVMDIESDSDILEANLSQGNLTININNGINTSASGAPSAIITINEIINSSDNQPLLINTGAMYLSLIHI